MSFNRLGAFSAALVGVGWLVAIIVNLGFWFPQLQAADLGPSFWDDNAAFLLFVRSNLFTWQVFHLGANVGLAGLIMLIPLASDVHGDDPRARALSTVGVVGAVAALVASLIDHLGTPVLARFSQGNSIVVFQIWEFVEPWRDAGLKTISFWFLGIWLLWLGGRLLVSDNGKYGRFTQISGIAFLLLALVETVTPKPLVYAIGETGIGGLVFLLIPVWGLWTARWFWQREIAAVRGRRASSE